MERKELVAYGAGLIDGEGCLSINKVNRGKYQFFTFSIIVVMTDKEPIERLHLLWGGSIAVVTRMPIKEGLERRTFYRWVVGSQKASAALKEMFPYLVGKRKEAEVAIAFSESIDEGKGYRYQKSKYGVRKIPKDVMEYREHLFYEIRQLKQVKYHRAVATTEFKNPVIQGCDSLTS